MFDRSKVDEILGLQERAYRLLLWLQDAVVSGFIASETAHRYSRVETAALEWIDEHYLNLPDNARPARGQLVAFSHLFVAFLDSSFEFHEKPGMRLYSPDAHCFCPCCSWMVRRPHLRTKKLAARDRKRATSLMVAYLRKLAIDTDCEVDDVRFSALIADESLREPIAICAYVIELFARSERRSEGPAGLALWRQFAWTKQGSPKKGFTLSTDVVLAAEQQVSLALATDSRGDTSA